jgi:hypothetical protein
MVSGMVIPLVGGFLHGAMCMPDKKQALQGFVVECLVNDAESSVRLSFRRPALG